MNNSQVDPKIDIYKLEISDKQHIYFNDSKFKKLLIGYEVLNRF